MRRHGTKRQIVKRKVCNGRSLAFKLRNYLEQERGMLYMLEHSIEVTEDDTERTAFCFFAGLSYYDEVHKDFLEKDKRFLAKLYVLAEKNPLFRLICLSRIIEGGILYEEDKDNALLLYLGEQSVKEAREVDAKDLLNHSTAILYEQMSRFCNPQKREEYIKQAIVCLEKISVNKFETAYWCRQLKRLAEEGDHEL